MNQQKQIEIKSMFSTPLGVVDTSIDTSLIKEYVLALNYESVNKSNLGGWQSPQLTQADIENTPLEVIVKTILEVFGQVNNAFPTNSVNVISNMWLNVNKKGNSNCRHTHGRSTWSGTFYISTPKDCGNFVAERADNADLVWNMDNKSEFTTVSNQIEPKEGLLIFFPSWMPHLVLPSNSDKPRISLSFNM